MEPMEPMDQKVGRKVDRNIKEKQKREQKKLPWLTVKSILLRYYMREVPKILL